MTTPDPIRDEAHEPPTEPKIVTAGKSQGQIVRQRFFAHRAAMTACIVLGLILVLIYTSVGVGPIPGWWKYSWLDQNPIINEGRPTLSLFPPSLGEHPFGQENTGKDYFALTMRGAQQSILVAFLAGLIATIVGTVVGALAGFYRGRVEQVLMRLTDLVITLPLLAIAAVLGSIVGASDGKGVLGWGMGLIAAVFGETGSIGVVIGLVSWTGLARVVRAEFLVLREREFVDAAILNGAHNFRVIFRHILPNAVGVIIVNATLLIAAAILLESSLSYLGFGVRSPDTSLGLLIQLYQNAFNTRPWLFWFPGIFIVVIALCVNFIGDGLRDAFDPKQKPKRNEGVLRNLLARVAATRGTNANPRLNQT